MLFNKKYNIEIRKSKKKKSISIYIKEGCILVSAPDKITNHDISNLLIDKKRWIEKKLEEQKKFLTRIERKFINNDEFYFFGEKFFLKTLVDKQNKVFIYNNQIVVRGDQKNIKRNLETWYKKEIKRYVLNRTNYFSSVIGVTFDKIKIRFYKRRLGCCSSLGVITYNWKIAMFPKEIIDYIIIH